MSDFNLFVLILVCAGAGYLLRQFSSDVTPHSWLVSLAMGGMVSALMLLLPSAQKGSPLALVGGYLLIGLIILSALILFGLSRLPGKIVPFNSPDLERTGGMLLSLLGVGLSVFLKTVLTAIATLSVVMVKILFGLIVLLITLLDGPSRPQPYLLRPEMTP